MKRMNSIQDAKRALANRFRNEDGFVGVGLFRHADQEGLRVYVLDGQTALARQLTLMPEFEGFPLIVEVSGAAQAQSW